MLQYGKSAHLVYNIPYTVTAISLLYPFILHTYPLAKYYLQNILSENRIDSNTHAITTERPMGICQFPRLDIRIDNLAISFLNKPLYSCGHWKMVKVDSQSIYKKVIRIQLHYHVRSRQIPPNDDFVVDRPYWTGKVAQLIHFQGTRKSYLRYRLYCTSVLPFVSWFI